MDTLTNVDNRRSGNLSPSARINTCTISSNNISGVSVENVHDGTRKWYVLRVSYYREQKAEKWLNAKGVKTFLPLREEVIEENGKCKTMRQPLINNMLFAYTTFEFLDEIIHDKGNNTISYYYNHFEVLPDGKNPPLFVPERQMHSFMQVTRVEDPHIVFVSPEECHLKKDSRVIVTGGPFKGVIGKVARIKRQQRAAVFLDGIGVVATAYIPSALIREY